MCESWDLFLSPPREGNSPVASQGVVVPPFHQRQITSTASCCSPGLVLSSEALPTTRGWWHLDWAYKGSSQGQSKPCCSCFQESTQQRSRGSSLGTECDSLDVPSLWDCIRLSWAPPQRKLQNADQRHHSTCCFSLRETLLNHSTLASWALQGNNIKAFQKILWFIFFNMKCHVPIWQIPFRMGHPGSV